MSKNIRPFYLLRKEDVSGISGTGIVAVGCIFPNGQVCLQWLTYTSSIVIHHSIEDVNEIHNHGGATEVIMGLPDDLNPKRKKSKKKESSNDKG
jgi:hypothetical protein